MSKEIPIERMPEALAVRIPCPAPGCAGIVRLGLGVADDGGDLAIWQCSSSMSHEWHEDGTPRWSIEHVADLVIEPGDSSTVKEEP